VSKDPLIGSAADPPVRIAPSARLLALRNLNARQAKIHGIDTALISSGYTALDEQAKAFGLRRSTAWTLIKNISVLLMKRVVFAKPIFRGAQV